MNEESLFAAAMEKPTLAEREAFLVETCGDDVALRQRMEILLVADEHGRGILERGPHDAFELTSHGSLEDPSIAEGPGDCIGPYKLKEKIGEGGFGLVFVAEQQQPIRRKVALKIIKPGMDTREVIARFEAERQALAMMDHPNIAKVLDVGTTGAEPEASARATIPAFVHASDSAGRPYFVMELVRGLPITEYCDREQITTRERLELFVPLCLAVQHAHHKGIIHRDLKPSNVLVTSHDGKPVVKVIDFGVAKALNQQLTEHSVYTRFTQMIGTPAYMSPEQAEMGGLDVDTRSDNYSLGVLLYELLTGSTPLDRKRLATLGFDELRRIIREEEPERPSTRLSHSQETLVSVAAQRKTEPVRLTRLLRGELDWIVMKALEKDRSRRYETASDFARDLQRYLADEPVQACPPSMAYRARKFFRRNKGPVLAASLVLVALLAGIFGTTTGLVAAQRERDDAVFARQEAENAHQAEARQRQIAEHNEKQALAAAGAEKEAKAAAEAREADTLAVVGFLERILFGKGGFVVAGTWETTTLRQAIAGAAPIVESEFANRPLVEARLRATLGWAFTFMREFKTAATHFERSHALYAAHRDQDDPDTLMSMTNLARAYAILNRNAEAAELREKALALQNGKLRDDHPRILENMDNLAQVYFRLGRDKDAVAIIDECVRLGARQSQDQLMFVRLSRLLELRLRQFEKAKDGPGCRTTAEMYEKLKGGDPTVLYNHARFRAVTAAVIRAANQSDSVPNAANVEADRAMAWLKQAVELGFNGVASIRENPDFRVLRDRDDFKMLVVILAARVGDGRK